MNKKFLSIGTVLLIAFAVIFASLYKIEQTSQADDSSSTIIGVKNIVNANNKFAFDLYSEIDKHEERNIFYSPYSISAALAMTYEGARGKTADEIKSVFYFPDKTLLRSNFAAIHNEINKKDKAYKLSTGNALWIQQDYKLLEEYISIVEKYYGGKALNVDFVRETEKSRQTINSFIEKQTNNKIKDLIPEGTIDASTRLVLTNAVYFKGLWMLEFDKTGTREHDFKITPENVVKISMMHAGNDEAKFNYADVGELQILELPYKDEDISMLILLPKYSLDNISSSLTLEKLEEWKNKMKKTNLDVYLPKLEFNAKYLMKEILINMGMTDAFEFGNADFSGIDQTKDLFIGQVIHQAFVKIDEEGTEAAAATAVGISITSARLREIFMADHPFIFIIQENKTGNILFFGRVVDPRE